jgi:hypothetical protein
MERSSAQQRCCDDDGKEIVRYVLQAAGPGDCHLSIAASVADTCLCGSRPHYVPHLCGGVIPIGETDEYKDHPLPGRSYRG